ncbi:M6 family metalloprotease domain-containing protein [Pseudomonas sp. microsymbiont 2]
MATPYSGKSFTFTQPDGTTIELKAWGNQYFAAFETLDGKPVRKNTNTGHYEVTHAKNNLAHPYAWLLDSETTKKPDLKSSEATQLVAEKGRAYSLNSFITMGGRRCDQRRRERSDQAKARRLAARAGAPVAAPPKRGTIGQYVGLCILIDFPDEPRTISEQEVHEFWNKPGYDGFGNNGSIRDYFLDNSIGKCDYSNITTPYYRAKRPESYYTDPSQPNGLRARELILEALASLKSSGYDFSSLTTDNLGLVYAMNIFYAGPVKNNWSEGLWPHAWHLEEAVSLLPGVSVFDYQFTNMGNELTLGTAAHENGHMLCDYPDLYDYGYESSGVGAFCLMCGGGNINEKNPTQISAYLKRMSGWANTVTTLEDGQLVTLQSGKNDFAILKKSPGLSGEYFIIENRNKSGRDINLPGEGLAIWHVDEDGSNSNEQMSSSSHYELSLEQADGRFDLEKWDSGYGDDEDLYGGHVKNFDDTTSPSSKWWDNSSSHLSIHEVSSPGTSMTFKVKK